MADIVGTVPFGIDDLQAEGRTAAGALSGTKVDLFGATGISLNTESDTQEARGDNKLIRLRRSNKKATGSASMLGHQPVGLGAIGEGSSTTTGMAPNLITVYEEPVALIESRYDLYAQASDGGGATRLTIFNCITTGGPNVDWSNESFNEPGWDFEASGDGTNLYEIAWYESEVAIA